ncbi:MAG: hypothetical protein COY40_00860 [Alphaproteobacteria bacterium CG_4_10_14_0_8_um_filter_53_9]|nr:MAG: hypothetical protein COY40_00860 [Alphaproteobacteria bacterium CG_4_10_14_0_8_um_filter_53_9]
MVQKTWLSSSVAILLTCGVVSLWGTSWVFHHEAMLAAIEPASGAAKEAPAEGGNEPKKSHTGKVLTADPTLPTVTIGGRTVLTAEELKAKEQAEDLGKAANNNPLKFKLQQQWQVKAYAHNPTRGKPDALVKVYEFSDLSCIQCMKYLTQADAAMKEGKSIYQTQIHAPVSQYQDTNLAAFYGKVAQRSGKFWEYREALQTLEAPKPEDYFDILLKIGSNRAEVRKILNTESRRLYRELDADADLAMRVRVGEPPAFIINGSKVGDGGIPREEFEVVLAYQEKQAIRREELARLNRPEEMKRP